MASRWLRNRHNVKCWQRTSVHEGGKRHKQKFVTQTTSSMNSAATVSVCWLLIKTDHDQFCLNVTSYTYRGHNISVFTPPESYRLLQSQDYPSVPCVLPYNFIFHHRDNNNNNNNLGTESVMKLLAVNFHPPSLLGQNILPACSSKTLKSASTRFHPYLHTAIPLPTREIGSVITTCWEKPRCTNFLW